ncbi:unnamed protein product, partial [Symbiodinium sp. KB8]
APGPRVETEFSLSDSFPAGCWAKAVLDNKAQVGRLEGSNTVTHGFASEAEARAYFAEGSVELLEFSWPLLQDVDIDQEPETCLAYAVMRRPAGFLLCLPTNFFKEADLLAGQAAEDDAILGPSFELQVAPVVLTDAGEWARAEDPTPVPCVVVDLSLRAADAVSQADLADSGARPFLPERPDTFPLASEVVRRCCAWVVENLAGIRSGYQTAVSEPLGRAAKPPPRAKRPTVANLAAQQETFAKALAGISAQLALLTSAPSPAQTEAAQPMQPPKARDALALSAPVAVKAPAPVAQAKALTALLGPPPGAKAASVLLGPEIQDPGPLHLDNRALVEEGDSSSPVAEAMLLQSRALAQLVSQLAQSADPLAELGSQPSSLSTRGTSSRQRMQAELAQREGQFAVRMRATALRRMSPTTADATILQEGLMTRYLERFGGYQGQQLVGLLQWQLAQISDLLASDCNQGAADLVAQAMIMLEQVAVDRGKHELAWLFTLQQDPPASIFASHQAMPTAALRPFAPLADAKLIACTMAFMKELDTLSTKRLELTGPKTKFCPFGPRQTPRPGPPSLRPYRDTDADRILIKGTGAWDLGRHLLYEPELCVPFRDPLVLTGIPANDLPFPGASSDTKASIMPLVRLWDSKGLLRIVPGPRSERELCRTFGAFKSEDFDRLIGDRRGPNGLEGRVVGPSRWLPPGNLLTLVSVPRFSSVLVGASTDRADFYHQASISDARAASNVVGPALSLDEFAGLTALADFKRKHLGRRSSLVTEPSADRHFYAAFGTLFQGDHGGVEYATAAHQDLLQDHGLLSLRDRLLGQHPVPRTSCYEALVIDDYFALSVEPLGPLTSCSPDQLRDRLLGAESTQRVLRAQAAYATESVAGSPAKDLLGALNFQAAGAFVDSSIESVLEGQVLVSSPPEKRLALSFLSLKAAALPGISRELAASLAGSWTSLLLFRKPLAACLSSFFSLGLGHVSGQAGSDVVTLSRKQAQELSLLAALAPVAVTNVALPFSKRVFCTDASLQKGAVVSAKIGSQPSEALWSSAARKGHYTMLDLSLSPSGAGRKPPGEEPARPDFCAEPAASDTKARPLGLDFDFLEVGCATFATSFARDFGLKVGPPFHDTVSSELAVEEPQVLDLLVYLVSCGRLRSVLGCVPARAFSWLSPRDRAFGRRVPARGLAEKRCLRLFLLLRACAAYGVPCLVLLPSWSGALQHSSYLGCLKLPTVCAGCSRRLGLAWISVWTPSPGCNPELLPAGPKQRIETDSFPGLPNEAARAIVLRLLAGARLAEKPEEYPEGLESVLVNDVLLTSSWEVDRAWAWRRRKHINVLESEAALQLYKDLTVRGGDLRFCLLTDSSVVLGSHRKGRSSARLLAPSLRRAAAVLCAGGLYPSLHFAPTRLNPADDPTRDKECRAASGTSLHELTDPRELARLGRLTRSTANWLRLFLLAGSPSARACKVRLRSLFGFPVTSRYCSRSLALQGRRLVEFDSTLGFPGEGPLFEKLFFCVCVALTASLGACVLQPRNTADLLRQRGRSPGLLPTGRPVQPRTKANRGPLTAAFSQWLLDVLGFSLDTALQRKPFDHDVFCEYVIAFGNDLYASGRPYWHYAETINALTSLRPSLRKQMQGAWDLAFTWLSEEPYVHHTAMPAPVLIAVLSTCLLWGWIKEAGIFALCWGALLRAGEATKLLRRDLVFPADALWGQSYILVRIQEPKTRGRAARHQSSKLEPSDLVELCSLAFERLPKTARVWSMSPQTLRKRLYDVLRRLGMSRSGGRERPLDLGSLRPGGATYLLQQTEDSELTRRRGRWVSHKVMEIYLQEVSASTFVADLDPDSRSRVLSASAAFPELLQRAQEWTRAGIPPSSWFYLWPYL